MNDPKNSTAESPDAIELAARRQRLRAIYRAAHRAAAGYLLQAHVEDDLYARGVLQPGDELLGTETRDGKLVYKIRRANGTVEEVSS